MTFDDTIPFQEAIAIAQRKQLLPTNLSSRQLSLLEAQLKQRSVFSARMDKADVLQVILNQIKLMGGGSSIDEENGRLRSVPEAKAQLKEALFAAGVPLPEPGSHPIENFYSDARRQLIVETNVLDTMGFGQHVARQDPATLFATPALELVRFRVPKGGPTAERDWNERWQDAYDELSPADQASCTDGTDRMVALVNHPIWQLLGDGAGGYKDTLGNSWEPYAFNSGMGRIAVSRSDAIELGLMGPDDTIEPDTSFDMNENLEASVSRFQGALRNELAGGGLEILGDVLQLVTNHRRSRIEAAFNALDRRMASTLAFPRPDRVEWLFRREEAQ